MSTIKALKDILGFKSAMSEISKRERGFRIGCGRYVVEIETPPFMEATERFRELLANNDGVVWTWGEHGNRTYFIGFAEAKHAVMFKLMLP